MPLFLVIGGGCGLVMMLGLGPIVFVVDVDLESSLTVHFVPPQDERLLE